MISLDIGMSRLLTVFALTFAAVLTSCQVPSSISLDSGGMADPILAAAIRIPVGLEAPTWESVKPKSNIPGWDRQIDATYFSIQTSKKVIAITFDDGPHGVNTPRLLDMLKKRKIKATFYVVGDMMKNTYAPPIMRRMVAEGHEVGNHSVTHANLSRQSDAVLRKELQVAHNMILEMTGVAPRTMRPPGGAIKNDQKKLMLKEFGYPTIMWSVDPEDWKKPGVSVVTSRLLNGVKPGGILLVHDLHKSSVDAMPATLDALLSRGYKFVTVTELIMMDESGAD